MSDQECLNHLETLIQFFIAYNQAMINLRIKLE